MHKPEVITSSGVRSLSTAVSMIGGMFETVCRVHRLLHDYISSNIARYLQEGGRLGELASLLSWLIWTVFRFTKKTGISALSCDFGVHYLRWRFED